jgi:pimeloyl-ACP methyl ester carboxylesterase
MRSERFPFAERFSTELAVSAATAGHVAGSHVAYFDAGVALDLPPVVLLHALGMNYTEWEYVASALSQHTRVVGMDLPGCGHSAPLPVGAGLAAVCTRIEHWMERLGLQSAVVVGHSFGGRLACELALRQPRRLAGLVLLNSAGFIRYPRIYSRLGRRVLRPAVVGTLMLGLAPMLVQRIFARRTPATQRFLDSVLGRWETAAAFRFAAYACPMLPDLTSDVLDRTSELALPIQVIWGDRDALLPYRQAEPALRRLPRVQIDVLPDCGHMPNIEAPDAVVSAVLRLLRLAKQSRPTASTASFLNT